MKGIVLSLGIPKIQRRRLPDVRYLLKRYGIYCLFALLLTGGLALGVFYAHNANAQTLRSLDFLFTTNLDARLGQSPFGVFCACFASDFLFLLCSYLFGIAAWGIPFLMALIAFKGFGTGVTAGFLCLSYSLSGAGFYLLVLLPGTFMFCVALVRFSTRAFDYSKRVFLHSVSKAVPASSPRQEFFLYGSRFLSSLLTTFFASLLDTLLWTLFAGTFQL